MRGSLPCHVHSRVMAGKRASHGLAFLTSTYMAQDTTQITLGTCDVTWGGVDLGHTFGGVVVTYSPEFTDIFADLYGNTVVDKYLIGEAIEVQLTLAQWDLDVTLDAAMPIAGTESATKRQYGSEAAQSLLAQAQRLVLHPSRLGASSRGEDIIIHKAAVTSAVPINLQNDNQKGMEVTFMGLIDTSKSAGNLLFEIGDSTT